MSNYLLHSDYFFYPAMTVIIAIAAAICLRLLRNTNSTAVILLRMMLWLVLGFSVFMIIKTLLRTAYIMEHPYELE